jgi:hypothetical protein
MEDGVGVSERVVVGVEGNDGIGLIDGREKAERRMNERRAGLIN